jgi:hypothetical protein
MARNLPESLMPRHLEKNGWVVRVEEEMPLSVSDRQGSPQHRQCHYTQLCCSSTITCDRSCVESLISPSCWYLWRRYFMFSSALRKSWSLLLSRARYPTEEPRNRYCNLYIEAHGALPRGIKETFPYQTPLELKSRYRVPRTLASDSLSI